MNSFTIIPLQGKGVKFGRWPRRLPCVNTAIVPSESTLRKRPTQPQRGRALEVMPSERYDDKIFTSAAAGTIADIFHANSEMVTTFAVKGILTEITPLLDADPDVKKDDWFDWTWVRAMYQDKIWAMTQKGNTTVTYYNKDLFDQAGVAYPAGKWTQEEFVETAHKLTDPEEDQFGTWTYNWHLAVWANQGDIISPDGQKCLLAEPAAYDAIQWVADLALKENVAPKAEQSEVFGSLNPFASGKVATYIGGEDVLGGFIESIDSFEWGAAMIPTGKETVGEGTSTMFPMSKSTKVLDSAWEFLKFLSGDIRAYEAMAKHGKLGIPPLKKAYDELFLGTEPRPDVKEVLAEMALYNRVWMLNVTAGAEAKTTVDQGLSLVWTGELSAKDACEELCPKLDEVLANQPR